jgi:PKD repeat protein
MKSKLLMIISMWMITGSLFAQGHDHTKCGSKLTDKEYKNFLDAIPKYEVWKRTQGANRMDPQYVIPVVFHMLTNGVNDGLNPTPLTKEIMKCRIDDAIRLANADFNGTDAATSTIDPRFQTLRTLLPIKFVAATIDPNGNKLEIPGLDWRPEIDINFGYENRLQSNVWFGKNGKYYMDIIITNFPNDDDGTTNQSAHAFLPTQDVIPHIVYNHRYIGNTCGSNASFGFAKVFTHEIGHYFGLSHTFQGGCTAPNDGISDTPPTAGSEGCTRNVQNSCGVFANLENFMDYNTTCQSMFTREQVSRMKFWLDDMTAKFPRKLLWQPSNLIATGVSPTVPVAKLGSEGSSICTGGTVKFLDQSTGLPTSRSWEFTGGTPGTSTAINPVVTYNTPGVYTVKLTVSNASGSNTTTQTSYIRVSNALTTDIVESFTGSFPPQGWKITNDDNSITFVKGTEGGNGDLNSLLIDNYFYKPGGKVDYITLPAINLSTGASTSQMTFDLSYVKENETSVDQLAVEVSTNCGSTWTTLYNKSKDALQTFTGTTLGQNRQFRPTLASHWRKETISLSAYAGQANVILRFKNTSGFGHRTWIDNVRVTKSGTTVVTPPTTTAYCAGTSNVDRFFITNVQLSNLNNTTSTVATNGYSDFTNQTANVTIGSSQTISVTSNYNNSTVPNHYNAWIDWNQDKVFDASEKVLTKTIGVTVTNSFIVPSTAKTGNTRMRVRYSFDAAFDACGNYTRFGEVEDYTVNVSGTTTTPPSTTLAVPGGIFASDITATGFFARYDRPVAPTVVEIQILENGAWITLGTATINNFRINKRGAALTYQFRVRAVNGTNVSAWSTPFTVNLPSSGAAGTLDDKTELTFKIYPNPASSEVYFDIPKEFSSNVIEIYDVTGRVVDKLINTERYNVSNLVKGVYQVKLISNDQTFNQQMIVVD